MRWSPTTTVTDRLVPGPTDVVTWSYVWNIDGTPRGPNGSAYAHDRTDYRRFRDVYLMHSDPHATFSNMRVGR